MKVFEVTTEYSRGDSREIITEHLYVTSKANSIKSVTDYFTQHCYEYDKSLIGVRDVLTIVQNIDDPPTEESTVASDVPPGQ